MTGPVGEERRVPPYVALVRIGAVVGMSIFTAFGLFLLIGAIWVAGLISLALALPFFVVMRLVESIAEPADEEPASDT